MPAVVGGKLLQGFVPVGTQKKLGMNGKFSRPAFDPADAHVPLGTADLNETLCFEHGWAVTNDYAARFECRLFQICKSNKLLSRPRDKVRGRIRLDGNCSILCNSNSDFKKYDIKEAWKGK
jgi:hypothetical protein